VTGVPVRTEFASAPDPREMRRALGLPAEVPVVLAMAGSWGSVGRLPDVARVLARIRRPVVGILVAGHDAGLRASLERLVAGSSLREFGFVPDLHRLMAAADLVVTKAGGMTLAAAMAVEVPPPFAGSRPGQVGCNERLAAAACVGPGACGPECGAGLGRRAGSRVDGTRARYPRRARAAGDVLPRRRACGARAGHRARHRGRRARGGLARLVAHEPLALRPASHGA